MDGMEILLSFDKKSCGILLKWFESKNIPRVTSWCPGVNMRWTSKTHKKHTSYLSQTKSSKHSLQKHAIFAQMHKFVGSSFPPKRASEELWSNFHQGGGFCRQSWVFPDVCTWWRKCCICSTNSAWKVNGRRDGTTGGGGGLASASWFFFTPGYLEKKHTHTHIFFSF